MKYLVGITLILSLNLAYANDEPYPITKNKIEYPDNVTLMNDKEHSRIEIHCQEIKNKSAAITCNFDQIMILVKNTDVLKDQLSRVKKLTDKEIQVEWRNLCTSLDQDNNLDKRIASIYANAQSNEERKSALDFKNMCTHPSVESYIQLIQDEIEQTASTCGILSRHYVQEFTYNNSTKKWAYQEAPSEIPSWTNNCGFVNFAYFEKLPPVYNMPAWKYVTRSIVTNKSGNFLTKKCSALTEGHTNIEKEIIYSSSLTNEGKSIQFMNCKYIDLIGF